MRSRSPLKRLMKQVRLQTIVDTKLGIVNAYSSLERGLGTTSGDESNRGVNFTIGQ